MEASSCLLRPKLLYLGPEMAKTFGGMMGPPLGIRNRSVVKIQVISRLVLHSKRLELGDIDTKWRIFGDFISHLRGFKLIYRTYS